MWVGQVHWDWLGVGLRHFGGNLLPYGEDDAPCVTCVDICSVGGAPASKVLPLFLGDLGEVGKFSHPYSEAVEGEVGGIVEGGVGLV